MSRLIIALTLFLTSLNAAFANEADHVANSDTIKITLTTPVADPDGSGNRILGASLSSTAAVAVVLRGVKDQDGKKFKIMQSRSVFGNIVWRDPKFLQLNPGKTLSLTQPEFKIVAPKGYGFSADTELEFDFGPKGEVFGKF